MPHVIVWDLETIPDISGFAAANDLVGKTDDEVRVAMGEKFPKHIYHSILCIGALIAHQNNDHWVVDALGAPHIGERSERELIAAFVDKIAELNPQLVTFNGSSFDLPVLRYRAMVHKIPAVGLAARPYFNRYTDDAIYLCDVLSSFAPGVKEVCRVMGLPGKAGRMLERGGAPVHSPDGASCLKMRCRPQPHVRQEHPHDRRGLSPLRPHISHVGPNSFPAI